MKIELRSERAYDDAAAKADTGRTRAEWFAIMDGFGGVDTGRSKINQHLHQDYKLDPWWISTLNVDYEDAHGAREHDNRPKGYTICATKAIAASPEACCDAFSSGEALDRWFGPDNEIDFRDGGAWGNGDGNRAVLRKCTPGKSIRMVWHDAYEGANTPVEIKFQPNGAKTTVMVTHERLQTREEADGLRRAWGGALDRLKKLLEA